MMMMKITRLHIWKKHQKEIQKALSHGPEVYELYSILIHRGSALGGHYYAYIKSFEKNKWHSFNDSSVTPIEPNELEEAFGDSTPKKSMGMGLGSGMGVGMMGMGAFQNLISSGSNGYMLLYRRVDPLRNQPEPSKESIPESLKMIFEEDSEKKVGGRRENKR